MGVDGAGAVPPGGGGTGGLGRVIMVIPTYNEAANLAWIVGRLRSAVPSVDVLVVEKPAEDEAGHGHSHGPGGHTH